MTSSSTRFKRERNVNDLCGILSLSLSITHLTGRLNVVVRAGRAERVHSSNQLMLEIEVQLVYWWRTSHLASEAINLSHLSGLMVGKDRRGIT